MRQIKLKLATLVALLLGLWLPSHAEGFYTTLVVSADQVSLELSAGFKAALNSNAASYTCDDGTWTSGTPLPTPPTRGTDAASGIEGPVTIWRILFSGMTSVKSLDLSNFDATNIREMAAMFNNCSSLTQVIFPSNFNTSSLTSVQKMFNNCSSLTTVDISMFNTSNVEDFSALFSGCSSLQTVQFGSGFTCNSATNIAEMFYGCSSLTQIDLSSFNTQCPVTNMSGMFDGCSSLTSVNLGSGFSAPECTSIANLFYGCSKLTSLSLPGWELPSVTNASSVFRGCSSLQTLNLSGWNLASLSDISGLFYGATGLVTVNMAGCNVSSVTDMSGLFRENTTLKTLDLSGWNTTNVTNMSKMFYNCTALETVNMTGWNTSKLTDMTRMFEGCSSLKTLDMSNWNTASLTDIRNMFCNCSSLKSLNLSGWNTSKLTNIYYTFYKCLQLSDLDLTGWTTGNVTDMSHAFYNCRSLKSLDYVKDWNTANVQNMQDMFYRCESLTSLDLRKWNTAKVSDMSYMFDQTISLTALDLSGFSMASNPSVTSMLYFAGKSGQAAPFEVPVASRDVYEYLMAGKTGIDNSRMVLVFPDDDGSAFYDYETVTGGVKAVLKTDFKTQLSKATGGTYTAGGLTWNTGDPVPNPAPDGMYGDKKVVDFSYLYYKLGDVTSLDLSRVNTSNATNLQDMCSNNSKLVSINLGEMNTASATNLTGMFSSSPALTTIEGIENLNTSKVENFYGVFYNASALDTLDLSAWNTSSATNMSVMFARCSSLTSLDIRGFTYDNNPTLTSMFDRTGKATDGVPATCNVGNPDKFDYLTERSTTLALDTTRLVLTYDGIGNSFFTYTAVDGGLKVALTDGFKEQLNKASDGIYFAEGSTWRSGDPVPNPAPGGMHDGEKVVDFSSLFYKLTNMKSLDLSLFDTRYATSMNRMLYNLTSLTNLTGVENFNTSNVTDFYGAFYGLEVLDSLDLSRWDTSSATDMGLMFANMYDITWLDISGFSFTNNPTVRQMFFYTGKLNLPGTCYVGSLENYTYLNSRASTTRISSSRLTLTYDTMFYTYTPIEGSDGYKVALSDDFKAQLSLASGGTYTADGVIWNTGDPLPNPAPNGMHDGKPVVDFSYLYYKLDKTTSLDLSQVDTRYATTLADMCSNNSKLVSVNLGEMCTDSVTNMTGMFSTNPSLITITGIENLNTSKVENFYGVFYNASALDTLDLSQWNTSSATNMGAMFGGCSGITHLDISGFTFSNDPTLTSMFGNTGKTTNGNPATCYVGSVDNYNYLNGKATTTGISTTQLKLTYDAPFYSYSAVDDGYKVALTDDFKTQLSLASGGTYTSDGETWNTGDPVPNPAPDGMHDGKPVVNFSYLYYKLSNTTSLDLSQVDTRYATNLQDMCSNNPKLVSVNLGEMNTSSVTNLTGMFSTNPSLTTIQGIEGLNTSKVTNFYGVFYNASALTSLDLSQWSNTSATNMGSMFGKCSSLTSLDISGFSFEGSPTVSSIFGDAGKTIDGNPAPCRVADEAAYNYLTAASTGIDTTRLRLYYDTSAVTGDINGDGIVDISDVNMAINMVLGKTEATTAADLNNDGLVDITDVNAIINIVLGK